MKNLTKIFTVVVAGMLAFSCVTDTTEDLGVNVNAGQHTLSVSMEAARTHLGEKAEGVYPLYWSEGDVIAVNGTASNPLAVDGDAANAVFQFGEAVAYPFNVVYPAVEGELNAVQFPATQEYAVGNIANGVAPMYGYSVEPTEGEEATPIQMNHLAGILRFAVKGNGEALKSLTVQAESGVLSGIFTVDCTSGALTAKEGSTSNAVAMTFGEGVTLSSEATLLHVAVPAGEYGALKIVLTTTEDKTMTLLLNTAGERAVEAGVVREFREFTFAENDVEREWFEIYTPADLLNFAKNHAVLPVTKGAKLMATVDMTGIEWTSIEAYSKIFDGGNENATVEGDNGICIKGLTAPLFVESSATIQNLKLTDVAISFDGPSSSKGALVCLMSGGSINNCKVTGTLSVSAPTSTLAFGGVVGYATGAATISHVVNHCAVSVDISNNKEVHIGGVLGRTAKPLSITYCDNYGALTLTGENTDKVRIGGIIGYISSGGETTAEYLNNHAVLTTTHKAGADAHIGGVFGSIYAKSSIKNSYNKPGANLNVYGVPGSTSIGGIAGYGSSVFDIDTCENSGNISFSYEAAAQTMIGGIYGYNNTSSANTIKNVTNHGSITVEGSNTNHIRTGGVIGYSHSNTTLENLTNNGAINVSASSKAAFCGGVIAYAGTNTGTNIINNGTVTYSGTATGEQLRFGGCISYASGGSYKTIKNNATATLTLTGASSKDYVYAGGIVGQNTSEIDGAENYATLSFGGSSVKAYQAGGIAGYSSKCIKNSKNFGDITFGGESSAAYYAGGVVGYSASVMCESITNEADAALSFTGKATTNFVLGGVVGQAEIGGSGFTNKGTIEVSGNADIFYAGGVVGLASNNLTSLTNEATATMAFNGTAVQYHNVGGVVGKAVCTALTTLENKAAVTFAGQSTTGTKPEYSNDTCASFGGVVGVVMGTADALCAVSGLTNSGVATIGALNKGLKTGYSNLGGVIGYAIYCNLDNCDNTATEFKQEATATIYKLEYGSNKHGVYIGGIAGYCNEMGTISNCDNSATLNLNANNAIHHYIGGLFGSVATSSETSVEVSNCKNNGNITPGATFTTKRFRLGGVAGTNTKVNYTQCSNSGIISYTPGTLLTNQFYCGGLFGVLSGGATSCINTGDITLGKNTTTSSATTYIGGLVGSNSGNCKDSHSLCDMTIDGEWVNTGARIGGAVGTTSTPLDNVTVFCNITAMGRSGKVGMVEGKAYAEASKAANCKIGGSLVFAKVDGGADANGDNQILDDPGKMTAENWFNYIYLGAITEEVATADGCSLLTEKPAVPTIQ